MRQAAARHEPQDPAFEPFAEALARHGRELVRAETAVLQVNLGLLCNQRCRHCHLSAGPERAEVMAGGTMHEVVAYAGRCQFSVSDVTGGAPEQERIRRI